MVKFTPQEYALNEAPLVSTSNVRWIPLLWHGCSFPPDLFHEVMLNLIRNPNINSNHLFRADILYESTGDAVPNHVDAAPRVVGIDGYELQTVMVRRLIPRKPQLDKALDQTCLIYESSSAKETRSLVIYIPHISAPSEAPFYHPPVRSIAFEHEYYPQRAEGKISLYFSFFEDAPRSDKLLRIAHHLLATLHKHGQGLQAGYTKRVQHDVLLPQATVQNTYSRLKTTYAKVLIERWTEQTDPSKHVFEDLGIAAFLIELWREMYGDKPFPGFVDIGCGNGLLVHILREEGFAGWGFDARRRKSWDTYSTATREQLKELVLIPSILQIDGAASCGSPGIHSGVFPPGTFIISNHADELTPWTPLLATLSASPFLMIPCCSHNLGGAKFRAPLPSKSSNTSNSSPQIAGSQYAALVAWVERLAADCGWVVEREMLRIPSTRNTGLVGRRRTSPSDEEAEDMVQRVLAAHGGAAGWVENAMKLVKQGPKAH